MKHDPWNGWRRRADLDERKDGVKLRVRFPAVAQALGLDHEAGAACVIATCRSLALKPCHEGKGYVCEACGDKGDMIDLVRQVRDCSLAGAVEFLEGLVDPHKDDRTGRLL